MKDASVLHIFHGHYKCLLLSSLCLPLPHPPLCERCFSVGHFSWTVRFSPPFAGLSLHPPLCERCFSVGQFSWTFNVFASLLPLPASPPPSPLPAILPFSLRRSHKTDILSKADNKRGPVGDCIACDPPKKDGQGFKRTWSFYYCRELGGFVSCRLL